MFQLWSRSDTRIFLQQHGPGSRVLLLGGDSAVLLGGRKHDDDDSAKGQQR